MTKQRSFANAVKWAYTGNWGDKGVSSLVTVLLAGMLGPSAFGMVSIAIVYVGILQVFLDQGMMAALIQRKEIEDEHLNAVFWTNQAFGIGLLATGLLLAKWWAVRNHAPAAAGLISVLSLDIPVMAMSIAHNAILRRELNFKSLSICSNVSAALGGLIGIGMAVAGFGAWSLVGQQLTKDAVNTFLLWRASSWRPLLKISWSHLRELLSFSVANFIAQLGILADLQASSVILGLFFGPLALGLYRIADRIMSSVVTMSMSAIQLVAFPEFSRHQNNRSDLRRSALTCLRLTAAVTLPALAGLAAVSTPLMATIGSKWTPASPVLKVLCVLGITIVFAYFTGPLLQALSMPRQLAVLEWARTAIGAVALVIAARFVGKASMESQIVGIALARFAVGVCLIAPAFVYIFLRICRISLHEFVVSIGPSIVSAISVVFTIMAFSYSGWLRSSSPALLLGIQTALGGTVGIAVLFIFETQLRRSVVAALRPALCWVSLAR